MEIIFSSHQQMLNIFIHQQNYKRLFSLSSFYEPLMHPSPQKPADHRLGVIADVNTRGLLTIDLYVL